MASLSQIHFMTLRKCQTSAMVEKPHILLSESVRDFIEMTYDNASLYKDNFLQPETAGILTEKHKKVKAVEGGWILWFSNT